MEEKNVYILWCCTVLCLRSQTFVRDVSLAQVELDKFCAVVQCTAHKQIVSYAVTKQTLFTQQSNKTVTGVRNSVIS